MTARQRGGAALTGRRAPRAFVPLRSTAGRRPLRSRKECAEWDVGYAVPYEIATGTLQKKGGQVSALYIPIIYDSAQRHDAL